MSVRLNIISRLTNQYLICLRGSQNVHLAILTPTKLVIYSVVLNEGSVEHGLYSM